MLGKLCKHEFNATVRWFLPLFAIALVLTPVTRIINSLDYNNTIYNSVQGLITFAYVVSLLVIGAACFLLIVYRFFKSMVTEEGYLMHTLPVSSSSLIWSKLIIAFFWGVASTLVIILSLFIMLYQPGCLSEFSKAFSMFFQEASGYISGGQFFLLSFELILLILICSFTQTLYFYASIGIGQVISKNKIAGSVAGFFILQLASQVIGVILMLLLGFFTNKLAIDMFSEHLSMSQSMSFLTNFLFPICIVFTLGLNVILFLMTNYSFKKKLNLE